MSDTERRYTERELALILKTAVERQDRVGAPASRGELTLAEIQSIAASVGIDPAHVAEAVRVLPSLEQPAGGFWGAPGRYQFVEVVPGRLSSEDIRELIDRLRTATALQGVVTEALDGVEWRAADAFGTAIMSVTPSGGDSRIRLLVARGDSAFATWAVGSMIGWVATGMVGFMLDADTIVELAAVVAGGMGATYFGVRATWNHFAGKIRERGQRLFTQLTSLTRDRDREP